MSRMHLGPSDTISEPHVTFFDAAALAEGLEAARREIETRFTQAGEVLAEAVEGIGSLTATLEEISQSLSPAATAATMQQVGDAAAQLLALPARQAARRGHIAALSARQAALAAQVDDMRRSLAYMRAFTLSIKIAGGGIRNADAGFHVFAQEIYMRVGAGQAEVDALAENLGQLKPALAKAASEAATLDQRCTDMIPAVPDELLASVAVMGEHQAKVARAMEEIAALARDIRQNVGRMLGALQIGDITRQRVEHVQTGLNLLRSLDPAASGPETANIRAAVCAVLAAQCASIVEDFDREVAALDAGLSALARDAGALLNLRALTYGENADVKGGFLHTLEQKVSAAVKLVAEIEKAENLALETGRQAAAAVRDLSVRLTEVQRMKTDVLCMALNTALKASRMGDEGRPLAIIAAELRTHAGYLESGANICVTSLRTLLDTADVMVAGQAEAEAGASLLDAVERISAASHKAEGDVGSLASRGEAVLRLFTRSAASFGFQRDIGERLSRAMRELAAQTMAAEPCPAAAARLLAELFDRLGAVYTMAREREIQAAIAERLNLDAAPQLARASAEDDVEDALF